MRDLWCLCVQSVDDCCLTLFDAWCERRAVIPLCYLLNVWPIVSASGSAICRLYAILDEILSNEAEGLMDRERKIINTILRNKCTLVEGLPAGVANAVCDVCSNRRYEVTLFDGGVV
ncbi:hypothetical protein Bxe_B2629 [Paraburkholderia xenovorans LB400]|uniref:Uncharacterized protein n=1 Tax=Paraburkholderia xenovorans (strain LB400) TaxID=266265 RepID=Q13RC5_PARXL|nr:hypothetical protein Bxe_B2629 [Paraburkholderia xenovorans LB400]